MKRPRQPRDPGEIERKFDNQIAALRSSAKAFDDGEHWEAERMSAAIQTLCHNHGQSVGLISQLGRDSQKFLDSSIQWDPFNKHAHSTLISITIGSGGPKWIAELDGRPMWFVDFDHWWTGAVITDGFDKGNTMSRRDLVGIMRNQDGGGHVDPMIDAAYAEMRKSVNWSDGSTDKKATVDAEYHAMRQIGHELLKSLLPEYRKKSSLPNDETIIRGVSFREAGKPEPLGRGEDYTLTPPKDSCGCKSGKPFRACHGKGAISPRIMPEQEKKTLVAPPGAAFARIGLGF